MAVFIANRILGGSQKYSFVFGLTLYKSFQDGVDAILIAEGREDLIVEGV